MIDKNPYEYARLELPIPPAWEYREQDVSSKKDDIDKEEEMPRVIIIEL